MKVKVQINDKKGLEELLGKDATMEAKIKDALVDAVGKRAAKAARAAIEKSIEMAVSDAIANFSGEEGKQVFEKHYGRVELTAAFRKAIRDEVDRRMMLSVWEEVRKMPEYKVLADALEIKTKEVTRINAGEVLVREARKELSKAMQMFDAIAKGASCGVVEETVGAASAK